MLKLLCPHCLKSVAMPDESAGQEAPCPECGRSFPIPARYRPTVAPAAPTVPLPLSPEPLPSHPLPIPLPASAVPPAGYTRSRSITISPCVVAWTPAVALAIIVILTFAPWVGVYPGPVYTQGAWRAITGYPKRDPQLERLLPKDLPPPSIEDRTHSDWLVMLPYVLMLILATALAWIERLEAHERRTGIPRRLPLFWPHRQAIIAAFASLALLFLAIQTARGLGLERALDAAVREKFEAARAAASDPREVNFDQALEFARDGLERTGWFYLAWCLHIVVLLAILGRAGLKRRGNKLPPRLMIQY
ncbi:MAG TPA: hypothetical protein VN641_19975 [Urbifossiella sp.]|nr:hypothetical protein [Urbifossiella sp.]